MQLETRTHSIEILREATQHNRPTSKMSKPAQRTALFSHVKPQLSTLPKELCHKIISILPRVDTICLAMTSHYFRDLVLKNRSTLRTLPFYRNTGYMS